MEEEVRVRVCIQGHDSFGNEFWISGFTNTLNRNDFLYTI